MIIPKYIYKISSVLLMLFLFASDVYAQAGTTAGGGSCGSGTFCNPLGSINSFSDFVAAVLDIVVSIGIPIAALAIIFSGFLFVTAQGNEEKLKTAKRAFMWSVIGTAVLLGAWAISEAISTTVESLR